MIRNHKGGALPLVIMIMVVLSVIGVTLLNISLSEAKLVSYEEKRIQAEYLARSGADAMAQYIIDHKDMIDDLIMAPKSDSVPLGKGSFAVEVYGDVDSVHIESTGTVDSVSQTVILTVGTSNLYSSVLHGKGISVSGGHAPEINGDIIYTDTANIPEQVKQDMLAHDPPYSVEQGEFPFPVVTPPDNSGLAMIDNDHTDDYDRWNNEYKLGYVNLASTNRIFDIHNDSWCHAITASANNATLTIQLGSGSPEDRKLKVETFDMRGGKVILNGEGRLLLYVDHFLGAGNVTINSGEIHIFVNTGGDFSLGGTPELEAAIYAPNAYVDLSGNGVFRGSVIGNQINVSGSLKLTHKPFDSSHLPVKVYKKLAYRSN